MNLFTQIGLNREGEDRFRAVQKHYESKFGRQSMSSTMRLLISEKFFRLQKESESKQA